MTEDNTQAVVTDAPVSATPDTQVENAQGNDLASFLNEYEAASTRTPQPEPTPVTVDPVAELTAKVDSLVREKTQAKDSEDYNNVLKQLGEGHELPEEVVEGFLAKQVRANPKINDIFINRERNPDAWSKLQSALKKSYGSYVNDKFGKKVDPNVTEDTNAVAAALRGSSTRAPEHAPIKLGSLSNNEFNEAVKQQFGFNPGV